MSGEMGDGAQGGEVDYPEGKRYWLNQADGLDLSVRNFIGGSSLESLSGDQSAISKDFSGDGRKLYALAAGCDADVNQAVSSARRAFLVGSWSNASVQYRKKVMYQLAALIEKHSDELALLECLDVGKPINEALTVDLPRVVATIRYFAEAADKHFGKAFVDGQGPNMNYQVYGPVGVVGAVVGWNFPLLLAAMKVSPALAVGNSIVLKPSEFSSLSAQRFAALACQAGVPEGVFNVVHGHGETVGATLANHCDVDLLTFTGSTSTGKKMMVSAGQSNMKRLLLECGGKSPYIVFDDCPEDLDFLAQDIVAKAFQNQGEVCSAGTRVLIHNTIKSRLLPKIVEQVEKIVPGNPLDPATSFGAMINSQHLEKVLSYINIGISEGAKKLIGGEHILSSSGGCYVTPAVFDDVQASHRIAREEIFGPVLSVLTFSDEKEALQLANDSDYGLAAYIATTDLRRAQGVASRINAGHISIIATSNVSPGGVAIGGESYKQSGFGCEGGLEGMMSYGVCKSTSIFV